MENFDRKAHWEKIYRTKKIDDVSWYQKKPMTSLDFLTENKIEKTASIIDIGGGDSYFVDYLLDLGYENISVLDISASAIERAKKRLGEKANKVKWIVADAANFTTDKKYDFWHDRAAFHFLTQEKEVENYINTVQKNLSEKGIFVSAHFQNKVRKNVAE